MCYRQLIFVSSRFNLELYIHAEYSILISQIRWHSLPVEDFSPVSSMMDTLYGLHKHKSECDVVKLDNVELILVVEYGLHISFDMYAQYSS